MGDGVAKESGLLICTDSFSIEDTVRLTFAPRCGARQGLMCL